MDEVKKDYFVAGDKGETYRYKIDREGLRDTFNIRRRLVNIFKPAYMRERARINFGSWLSIGKSGYCFAPSKAEPEDGTMAMDVITKNGFITEIVVGEIASCEQATVDQDFKSRFPKQKKQKMGGGC